MLKSLKLLLFTFLLGLTSQANAVAIAPNAIINEVFSGNTGAYSVTNLSGYQIVAFAVGSNTSVAASTTYRNLWDARVVNEAEWNAGTLYVASPDIHTNNYLYQNYFAGYSRVNLYSLIDDFGIQPGETTGYEFFYTASQPNSSFLAFYQNSNGGIGVISGQATVVPVPGAAVLFGSGLLALTQIKRRKA